MDFQLITDSVFDLNQSYADKLDFAVIPMEFSLDGTAYLHYADCRSLSIKDFYKALKDGADAHTTQINIERYMNTFTPFLENGRDILYICFTSGLSGSYNTCMIAVDELKEQFPQRRIEVIDCACASIGQGNLVYHTAKYIQKNSPDLDSAKQYAEELKKKICHWFVVEDFDQLKKGGRVSSVAATFGKALHIKPLLSVDNDGKLLTVAKVRGDLKAYDALVNRLVAHGEDIKQQTVFIGHSDAIEKAEKLKRMVAPLVKKVIITDIGPVIGTHVGVGMLALSFIGKRIFE